MARCTAKSKRTGERCKRSCAPGYIVCKFHGQGAGAPLKHGSRSKHLPKNLQEKFEEVQDDELLVVNRDNIRMVEAMIRACLDQLKDVQPALLWQEALALFDKAKVGGDEGLAALRQLGKVLQNGDGAAKARTDLITLMETQRKHRETENRRVAANEFNLNAREANALITALRAAVDQEVNDTEVKRRIAVRFMGILRAKTGGALA